MTITIELRDDVAQRLDTEAKRRNTTVERLIADNLDRLFVTPSLQPEQDFQRKLNQILAQDHELLRRLA